MANTGVPALPDDVQEKLNNMCPAAAQLRLGDFLAAVKATLEDHEARIVAEELDGLRQQFIPLAFQGTLGCDVGPGADGVLFGTLTDQAVAAAIAADGEELTDETAAANNATSNDMTLLPATPAENDAYYFGYAQPFTAVVVNITTRGEGTWTITWEYWNGTEWDTLVAEDGTVGFTATTGSKLVSFVPPADWQSYTVNEQGPFYYVRARVSAYTDITTQPKGGQAWVLDLRHGTGLSMPTAGTVTGVQFTADTDSGTAGDSVFLVINLNDGTYAVATWTKAQVLDRETGLELAFAAGDQLIVRQALEDGANEFAGANIVLEVTYGA
jgi:hypothetical protein